MVIKPLPCVAGCAVALLCAMDSVASAAKPPNEKVDGDRLMATLREIPTARSALGDAPSVGGLAKTESWVESSLRAMGYAPTLEPFPHIVEDYVQTREPVGSKSLAERHGLQAEVIGHHRGAKRFDKARGLLDRSRALIAYGREHGPFDVVLSDMAPSTSGNRDSDQARSYELVMHALELAKQGGKPGSSFVAKIFMGPDYEAARKAMRDVYRDVRTLRPETVRKNSIEVFLVGLGKRS